MKKRIIWKMFLLEIVTLGIYRLYWLFKTRGEMMRTNPAIKIKSPWFLLIPILVIIGSFILMFVVLFAASISSTDCTTGPVTVNTKTANGVVTTVDNKNSYSTSGCSDIKNANVVSLIAAVILYLSIPVALVFYVIWLWGYCHGVEIVTGEKIGFAMAMVILVLVPDGVDILIIQDGFNKAVDRATGVSPGQPMPPAQASPPVQPMPPAAPQPPVNPPAPVQFQLA